MHRLVVGGSITATPDFKRRGEPAPIEGVPVWTSTNPAVADVIPSVDGMKATIRAIGPGEAQVAVTATTAVGVLTSPPVEIHVDLPDAHSAPGMETDSPPNVPMEIEVTCPNCFKRGHVPDATVGKNARCYYCQTVFVVEFHKEVKESVGPVCAQEQISALDEFVGQDELKNALATKIRTANLLQTPLPHLLLCGPPDSGKATLAFLVAKSLGVLCQVASASTTKSPAELLPFLTNATDRSILVLEDIDLLSGVACEFLSPALEDSKVDIVLGDGVNARTISMPLKRFTVIGTSAKPSRINKRLVRWFGAYDFKPYSTDEFYRWVGTLTTKAGLQVPAESLLLLVNCCQGSLLYASALVKKIRKYMQESGDRTLTPETTQRVLSWLGYEEGRTHSLTLVEKVKSMTGPEFEEFVARLFRRKGYVVELTEITGDHGIDLLMHHEGARKVVQCKCWNDSVGEPVIRDFYGAMLNSQAQFGFVVTTAYFSRQAIAFAEDKPITLVDLDSLLAMCRDVESPKTS